MKNKKTTLFVMAMGLTVCSTFAQRNEKDWYVKVTAGYSLFSPGGDPLLYSPLFLVSVSGQLPVMNSSAKSGEGLNLGVAIEKTLNRNLLAGLTINYLDGKKFSAMGTYATAAPDSWTATGTQSVWSAIPGISFKLLPQPRYYIYTRLGLIFAFNIKYHDNETFTIPNGQVFKEVDDYKYGLNEGIQAALGVQFNLPYNVRGFVEINNNFMDASPDKMENQETLIFPYTSSPFLSHNEIIYLKSNSGSTSSGTNSSGTNIIPQTSIVQHFNSTVLSIGVALAIK